jgi:hypothetical protein
MRDCRARWADQLVQQFCDEYPERYLLAFVYGYLATTTSCARAPRPRNPCCWPPSTSWNASPSSDP